MIERLRQQAAANRNLLLLVIAIGCGAIAVFAGQRYLGDRLEAERARLAPKPVRTVDVVVARRDLAKGDPISAETMAVRPIPLDYVASGAIRPERFDDVQGGRLALPMRAGEALLASAIVGGEQVAFSSRVKPGIRALTIAVDEINSISGMLQPGDRIDLLFSAKPPDAARGHTQVPEATIPLFQNLLVLATGRQVRAGVDGRQPGQAGRSFTSVTVEIEPEPAQRLVVAQRAGKLTAILRNPDDSTRMAGKAMDIRQLLDIAPPPRAAPRWQGPQIIVGRAGGGTRHVAPQSAGEPSVQALTTRSSSAASGPGSDASTSPAITSPSTA